MGCKTDSANHTERVVGVGGVWVQGCSQQAIVQVSYAAKGIYKRAIILSLQTQRQSIYRKIPTLLVLLQSAILNHRLSGISVIGLLAGAYKLHLYPLIVEHCSTKIAIDRYFTPDNFANPLGQSYAAALHNNIYILAWSAKKGIPYKSAYNKGSYSLLLCGLGDYSKDLVL